MAQSDGAAERKRLEAVQSTPTPAKQAEPQTLKRTATKEVSWRAWAGPISDLRMINTRFDEQVESRRADLLRDVTDDYERRRIEREFESGIALRVEGQEVTGAFDQLVNELDPRTWRSLVWNSGTDYSNECVRVQIINQTHLGALGDVVVVKVKSADPGFVASTIASLSEAVNLSKPRWAWLHTGWGRAFVGIMTAAGIGGSALSILRYYSITISPNSGLSWFISILWLFSIGLWAHLLLPKVIPPAEIRFDTVMASQGSRFVGWFVGVLLLPLILSLVFWLLPPR